MENATNQQLTQIMGEIQSIKSIIHQKKPVLHILLHPKHLKIFMLLTGISVCFFSLVHYYFEQRYGSFSASPPPIPGVYYFLAALVGIVLWCLFFVFWSKSLRKNGGKFTGDHAWSGVLSFRVINLILPVRLIALVLIIYCIKYEMLFYIIPTLSIAIGLQFNFLGCITDTRNYVIGGYWFMTTAVIIFLNNSIPGSLAVLFSLGCGSLLFGFLPNPEK
ncbi:hypothetical protein KKI24_16980 [bacterium]|nr:hypothetical protein [bacterium]